MAVWTGYKAVSLCESSLEALNLLLNEHSELSTEAARAWKSGGWSAALPL